jgi:hypothetical protein
MEQQELHAVDSIVLFSKVYLVRGSRFFCAKLCTICGHTFDQ